MQIVPVIALLLLVAAAFALCGYLFVTLKRELQLLDRRRRNESEQAQRQLGALEIQIADLRKDIDALPEPAHASAPQIALNLNRRTQALRMLRHGEASEHIAATLSLPRKEVELLVKVQRLLLEPSSDATS